MYIIYCLILWVFVYILPALAFCPQLIRSPKYAFAIPILSALVIYVATTFCIEIHYFNRTAVLGMTALLAGIAFFRLRRLLLSQPLWWSKREGGLYGLNILLLCPYLVKLGTHAFDRGDEIYSWHFWAIQHYFLEPIDFSHTGAPYPQLFPKLLAYSYHLLGNWDYQLPLKATLIIFPFAMLTAIAMTSLQTRVQKGTYLFFTIYVLFGVGLARFFDNGYADPLMTSSLVVSAALFWQSRVEKEGRLYAWIAAFCAITCAHAKQPGLLWAMFSLPLLWILDYRVFKQKTFLFAGLLSLIGGGCWLIGEGQQFHQNEGVLSLSLAGRDLGAQLVYSANQYLVQKPSLLILFLLAIYSSFQVKRLRQMLLWYAMPSLLLWFWFGAYQLRLGQHLIGFAFLIIAASQYALPMKESVVKIWRHCLARAYWWQKPLIAGICIVSLGASTALYFKEMGGEKKQLSLYAGGRQSLERYFGLEADFVYTTLYSDPSLLLWVPSRYLYGLFYKHTRLTSPDYTQYAVYNHSSLVDELIRKSPDYVFTVSENVAGGSGSRLLKEVLTQCPSAFERVTQTENKHHFVIYQINKRRLEQDPCLVAFRQGVLAGKE